MNKQENEIEIIELDEYNFLDQIIRHGYFNNNFPSCFSSDLLADNINSIISKIPIGKAQLKNGKFHSTSPTLLSAYKTVNTRRTLSLPNPVAFIRLVKFMNENFKYIRTFSESENSLSPITYLHEYNDDLNFEYLNSEEIRDAFRSKSSYIQGVKKTIEKSIGYKYLLELDISNCYHSIYTHSITWAVCGKKEAKEYFRTKQGAKEIKDKYKLADSLDAFKRFMKNNETNGIVVTPFTSRIFSEIILSGVDRELRENGFVFTRYVDDFKFFFRTEHEAQKSIIIISQVLHEYNFQVNSEKTKISLFPYTIVEDLNYKLSRQIKDKDLLSILQESMILYENGNVGVFRYALKLIENSHNLTIAAEDINSIVSLLINLVLIQPKNGKYVKKILKNKIKNWCPIQISKVINDELFFLIKDHKEEESLVFMQMIRELDLFIDGRNIEQILHNDNDFLIIMALDFWQHADSKVCRNIKEARDINVLIKKLSEDLNGENYNGSRWLLLHEILLNSLMKEPLLPKPDKDEHFEKMKELNIKFFKSIKDS